MMPLSSVRKDKYPCVRSSSFGTGSTARSFELDALLASQTDNNHRLRRARMDYARATRSLDTGCYSPESDMGSRDSLRVYDPRDESLLRYPMRKLTDYTSGLRDAVTGTGLSRRHSISFDSPPPSQLSKMKSFSKLTPADSRRRVGGSFEFVCSPGFQEKYTSYVKGLDGDSGTKTTQHRPLSLHVGTAQSFTRKDENTTTPLVQQGLCSLCHARNDCKVPQSCHVAEMRKVGGIGLSCDHPESYNQVVYGERKAMSLGGSPSSSSRFENGGSFKGIQKRKQRRTSISSSRSLLGQSPMYQGLGASLKSPKPAVFTFTNALCTGGVWLSSRGHIARSLEQKQILVAHPGFAGGTHSWRISIMSCLSPPPELKELCGDECLPVTPESSNFRSRSSSSGSDYAVPWDAIKKSTTRLESQKKASAGFVASARPINSKHLSLAVGICARPASSDVDTGSLDEAGLDESAAIMVDISSRQSVQKTVSTSDLGNSIRSWLSSKRQDRQSSPEAVTGSPGSCVFNLGMRWGSGDTGTVTADCASQLLTIANHVSGEVSSICLQGMLDDDEGEPSCDSSQQGGERTPLGRPAHASSARWLHPYFFLDDPTIIVALM